jgi:predicted PurR-regulated permease PerM
MLWRALEVMHPLFAAGLFCTLLGVLISRLRPKMSPESQGRLGCVLGCLFLVLSVLLYIFVFRDYSDRRAELARVRICQGESRTSLEAFASKVTE